MQDKTVINALGIAFSQGVKKGSQGIAMYDNMYDITIYSLLMLQDCLKMLVFDRLGLSLYSGILQSVQRYSPIPLIPVHKQHRSDVSLASTLDEYSQLLCSSFPPYPYDDTSDDGAQEPDDAAGAFYQEGPDGTYYWVEPADQDQLGGSQAGGLRLFDHVSLFVLAYLRHP